MAAMSVLDGWWAEGYDRESGWAIGSGEEYSNTEYPGPG
jgi:starch phosphorylase